MLAKAMTMGGQKTRKQACKALQSFQEKVFAKLAKTVSSGSFTQQDTCNLHVLPAQLPISDCRAEL